MTRRVVPPRRRPQLPMPAAIRHALIGRGLLTAYRARPAYQQNDYLAWIARAKLEATQARRIAQMLDELERGDRYMKMPHRRSRPSAERRGR